MEVDNSKEMQINLEKQIGQGHHLKEGEVEVHINNHQCYIKDACQTFNLY